MDFPIHPCDREHLRSVPWDVVAPHDAQALQNHSQTLKRLAERGGLALCELAAVLEGREWRPMARAAALEVIQRHVAAKRRRTET